MRYSVHSFQTVGITIRVDADDPDDAVDKALEVELPGICSQCSGWRTDWSREDDGELQPVLVINENGEAVAEWPSEINRLHEENRDLRAQLAVARRNR